MHISDVNYVFFFSFQFSKHMNMILRNMFNYCNKHIPKPAYIHTHNHTQQTHTNTHIHIAHTPIYQHHVAWIMHRAEMQNQNTWMDITYNFGITCFKGIPFWLLCSIFGNTMLKVILVYHWLQIMAKKKPVHHTFFKTYFLSFQILAYSAPT